MLIEEKRPTLILIDEAWKVLDDDYFSKKLAEWLVTARKKNVVVVMMTQFPSQIRGSKARSILDALPNQLVFPNGEAASSDCASFRLTDGELDFVLNPIPGALKRRLRTTCGTCPVRWKRSRTICCPDHGPSRVKLRSSTIGGKQRRVMPRVLLVWPIALARWTTG